MPLVAQRVSDMLDKWSAMSSSGGGSGGGSGEIEIEVCDWFQTLTEDVITRTVFGCSYEDGKTIFRLQAQQMMLAAQSFQNVYIPGYR